jgi:hypothetical protein
VPTTRRRHLITETEEVVRALDAAAERWPEDSASRSKLLLRLLREGHRALVEHHEDRLAVRRDAVERTAGALKGVYGENYLAQLREDWPA